MHILTQSLVAFICTRVVPINHLKNREGMFTIRQGGRSGPMCLFIEGIREEYNSK